MFFLLYRHTDHADDGVIDDFRPLSEGFQRFSKIVSNAWRTFPNIFRKFPKIFEKDPKMFRSYTNELMYNLTDKLDISEIIDIFTSEDTENTPLESRMLFRMNFTSGVFSSKALVSI